MKIAEIFAVGYGHSDHGYQGGHRDHHHDKDHHHGGDYDRRSLSDRDTPIARLRGSSTF